MVRLWSSRHAGKLLRSFLFTVCTSLNFTRFMTLNSPSSVFPFYLSDIFFFYMDVHYCRFGIHLQVLILLSRKISYRSGYKLAGKHVYNLVGCIEHNA